MTLIGLLVAIAVAAVVLWGVTQLPMLDPGLKAIIKIVAYCVIAIMVIVFLAEMLGYQGSVRLR